MSSSPPTSKKPKISKLKTQSSKKETVRPVDPMYLFGGETKRVEAKKPPKPKEKSLLEFEDDDIDASLMEIDLEKSILEVKENKPKRATEGSHSQQNKQTPEDKKHLAAVIKNEEKIIPNREHKMQRLKNHSPKYEDDEDKPKKKKAKDKHQDLESSKFKLFSFPTQASFRNSLSAH